MEKKIDEDTSLDDEQRSIMKKKLEDIFADYRRLLRRCWGEWSQDEQFYYVDAKDLAFELELIFEPSEQLTEVLNELRKPEVLKMREHQASDVLAKLSKLQNPGAPELDALQLPAKWELKSVPDSRVRKYEWKIESSGGGEYDERLYEFDSSEVLRKELEAIGLKKMGDIWNICSSDEYKFSLTRGEWIMCLHLVEYCRTNYSGPPSNLSEEQQGWISKYDEKFKKELKKKRKEELRKKSKEGLEKKRKKEAEKGEKNVSMGGLFD